MYLLPLLTQANLRYSIRIMELTEIPFGLPGRVFRSAMPFSGYDPGAELVPLYHRNGVAVVVQLASDAEALRVARRDLRQLYATEGFEVIYLPIPDFGVPSLAQLTPAVEAALVHAVSGRNLVVHCHAGIGRSGVFLACMARRGLVMGGQQAVRWVRQYIPGALEVPEQVDLAVNFS